MEGLNPLFFFFDDSYFVPSAKLLQVTWPQLDAPCLKPLAQLPSDSGWSEDRAGTSRGSGLVVSGACWLWHRCVTWPVASIPTWPGGSVSGTSMILFESAHLIRPSTSRITSIVVNSKSTV